MHAVSVLAFLTCAQKPNKGVMLDLARKTIHMCINATSCPPRHNIGACLLSKHDQTCHHMQAPKTCCHTQTLLQLIAHLQIGCQVIAIAGPRVDVEGMRSQMSNIQGVVRPIKSPKEGTACTYAHRSTNKAIQCTCLNTTLLIGA